MNIFFSSDQHFGHRRICEYEPISRPFASVEEMDEILIERWNSKVKKNDESYILGDYSFHNLEKTIEITKRLNGSKRLIIGNHDIKLLKYEEFHDLFEKRVFNLLDIKLNKIKYTLCHYPMMSWNCSHHDNSYQLFGHVHSRWKGNNKQLNVGVDVHKLYPVELSEIQDLLKVLPPKGLTFSDD
jgi:calcineurin-like phosphoesterase family protein